MVDQNLDQSLPIVTTYSSYAVRANALLKSNFANMGRTTDWRKNPNLKDLLVRAKLRKMTMHWGPQALPKVARSTVGGRTYLLQRGTNVSTGNCVYLIWCGRCQMQYVGETKNSLGTCLATHRRGPFQGNSPGSPFPDPRTAVPASTGSPRQPWMDYGTTAMGRKLVDPTTGYTFSERLE